MNALLKNVLDAHGGLERWRGLKLVRATIVTGGEFWGMKGLVQDPQPRQMTVSLHEQRASLLPFGAPDWRTAFTPDRIAIETTDGKIIAEGRDPRKTFAGHEQKTPWGPLHRAYFNGYALWTYLTTPFLLAMAGVEVTEVDPWKEDDDVWRRLRARFPTNLATHSDIQDFYFDRELRLRRHDYSVDVAGGFPAAQHVYDYTEANGIRLPTRRRAFQRGADDRVIEDPLMVSIDLSQVHFT
jgi:hypothetical protein